MHISAERIAQIEARRDEVQASMTRADLAPDQFVRLSKEYAEIEPVAAAARELRRQGGQTACGHRGGTVHKKWIRLENGSRQIAGFSFCLKYDMILSKV